MSVDYYCYLGPALICEPSKKIVVKDHFSHPEMVDVNIDIFVVSEHLNEALSFLYTPDDQKLHIYTPNINRQPPRKFTFDCKNDQIYQDLSLVKPEDEITWFNDKFAPEIKIIEDIYGIDNVKTAWIWTNRIM